MANAEYCLRWNNHLPNIISVFSSLLTNECLVDVTLAAEGRYLQAHKVVLSACSSYFQELFSVNPCRHPIVVLKDVAYNDLKCVVDFIYFGEVNVSQDRLHSILKVAEMLNIKGLTHMPTVIETNKEAAEKRSVKFSSLFCKKKPRLCENIFDSTASSSVDELDTSGPSNLATLKTEDISNLSRTNTSSKLDDNFFHNGLQNTDTMDSNRDMSLIIECPTICEPRSLACEENAGSTSVITGVRKRNRLLRQPHIVVKTDHEDDEMDDNAPLASKRPLGRQYSDPTPQLNPLLTNTPPDPSFGLLAVPSSHLIKQNSDSALPLQNDTHDSSIKTDEMIQRTISQVAQIRSNHCPMLRPGPALGCNYCWNTVDNHGRILRRKTKYHCPECRTNLCIVPCFQDYHIRKERNVSDGEQYKQNDNKTDSDMAAVPTQSCSVQKIPTTATITKS